ncbi:MAG TPA: hypothetical protein VEP30_01270 [Chthoniobacterales bacterium]|nr:hypothetical protein [Chthoniobacterales bacterium]
MHEATLRDFLTGAVTTDVVRQDLVGTVEKLGDKMYQHHIASLEGEFHVNTSHLIRVCDAVLSGGLDPADLKTIAFCMVASDYFHWDDDTQEAERVGETLHDWASPEINYPLTLETVRLFRERLATGKDVFKDTRMT